MNTISLSEFKALGSAKIKELLPLTIFVDGEPEMVVDKPENVITLSDLHPRVQNRLRGQEQLARAGMPAPVRTTNMPENKP